MERKIASLPAECAIESGRESDISRHSLAVEAKVELHVALRRRGGASDAIKVRRLRLDEHLLVERRGTLDSGDAGVEMPKRMRAPAVAVAASIDVRRFENRREIPLEAVAPEA